MRKLNDRTVAKLLGVITLLFSSLCSGIEIKPPPPPPPGPSQQQSLELAVTAIENCKKSGYSIAVAVVDIKGRIRILLAADGMGGTPYTSAKKAKTSLKYNMLGVEMEELEKRDKAFALEVEADSANLNAHGGSRPLFLNGKTIGAIGASGAPHAAGQACVDAAALKSSL